MFKIYSTKTCVYCTQVERLLKSKNIPYEKIMLDDNPELRKELFDKTNAMTVPITEYEGKFVVGWNIKKLNDLINQKKGLHQ